MLEYATGKQNTQPFKTHNHRYLNHHHTIAVKKLPTHATT
jgi:hypothetical protein